MRDGSLGAGAFYSRGVCGLDSYTGRRVTTAIVLRRTVYNPEMRGLSQWWFEGEADAQIVYRQSLNGFLAAVAASAAIFGFIPSFRTWYVLAICVCLIGRALAERRRALILTDSSITYRPAFGRGKRIELDQVVSVEKCQAPVPFWTRPGLFAGLRFQLKNHEDVVFPLDFPNSQDISQRLLTILNQ